MLPLATVAAHGRDLEADQYWRGDLHACPFVLSFVFDFRVLPSLLNALCRDTVFRFFWKVWWMASANAGLRNPHT